ncbi:hypothetical protein RJ639_045069, partial [Escallonia herrerae]
PTVKLITLLRDFLLCLQGGRINLDLQLLNHGITIPRIFLLQKNVTFTKEYLSKCIYAVGMGSNDYINNYFMPKLYITSRLFTPDQYATTLIQQYTSQLMSVLHSAFMTLYNYGARKVATFGLGQIGCTPAELGITVINTPCCNATKSSGLCYRNQAPCSNRSTYAFWDAFHPTEIINVITAGRVYNTSSPLDAYPVDICTLAGL